MPSCGECLMRDVEVVRLDADGRCPRCGADYSAALPPKRLTHWAPPDAAYSRRRHARQAVCGEYVRERDLVQHGDEPTCLTCNQRFVEFEQLEIE